MGQLVAACSSLWLVLKGLDLRSDDGESYVFNPINAFHLMQRSSNFWPRVKKLLNDSTESDVNSVSKEDIIFPEKSDFLHGASFGLVNLQIMHQLNTSEMIRGEVRVGELKA